MTIRLLDFSRCVQIKELHKKLGIIKPTVFPEIKFEKEIVRTVTTKEIDPDELQIDRKLKKSYIDLDFEDIQINDDDFLSFEGRKVAAYIRDQNVSRFGAYRYHLCNCSTLQDMDSKGRLKKYFVTKNDSGEFLVNDISQNPPNERYLKLSLCQNCIKVLYRKKMYFRDFNLKKFFTLHDTYVPREIVKSERITEIQTYVPEHEEIARRYKKMAEYSCENCGLKCCNHRHLLHLHHVNGVKSDNYPHNLQVLCVSCHSKAPDHGHLKNKFSEQLETIKKMRREQSIVDLENYCRN